MKQITRASALALTFVMLFCAVSLNIGETRAELAPTVPGTQAYYEEIWEDAKILAGSLPAGTPYTNHQGTAAVTAAEGPWKLDIDYTACSIPWNGALAGTAMTAADTVSGGAYNAATNPYKVYTAEQFRYVMVNRHSYILQRDIDLGGHLGRKWETPVGAASTAFIADGNGKTVYNYYITDIVRPGGAVINAYEPENNVSLFGMPKDTYAHEIKNLRISNAYIKDSTVLQAAFLFTGYIDDNVSVSNCAVENSMGCTVNSNNDKYFSAFTMFGRSYDNCYARNVHVYNRGFQGTSMAHAGGFILRSDGMKMSNCFAIDGTVISFGGHSGGFYSCTNPLTRGGDKISNCFTNNEVYGNSETGVFAGVVGNGTAEFKNCYASGKIEGTKLLGGFFATDAYPYATSFTVDFINCYTTSMVGIYNKGENLGGFLSRKTAPGGQCNITRCYAAGEVGSIDTTSDLNRMTNKDVGGFVGDSVGISYSNCYYDKQTTAMREWAGGAYLNGTHSSPAGTTATGVLANVKGLLTTDTEKSGAGLAGTTPKPGLDSANGWVLSEDHYPQLDVFVNPTTFTNTNWMTQQEMNALVKAYSIASTSTVKLETWEEDYQGGPLPATTYDTVRDITHCFNMTSSNDVGWAKVGNGPRLNNGSGNSVTLYGRTFPIFTIFKAGADWCADNLAPGVEWLRVNAKVDGQTGTRSLRVCPTSNLYAGERTADVPTGQVPPLYDHADDCRLAFSTGHRLAFEDEETGLPDITEGVFPDYPLGAPQSAVQTGTIPASFYSDNGKYISLDADYMSWDMRHKGPEPSNATGGKLYVRGNLLGSIDQITGKVTLGADIGLDNSGSANPFNDKFNGYAPFDPADKGNYVLSYFWTLQDGRYLKDSKLVRVRSYEQTLTVKAENEDGTPNGGALYIDAYTSASDLGGSPRAEATVTQTTGSPAAASWKIAGRAEVVKLTVRSGSDDEGWAEVVAGNPVAGTEIVVPRNHYVNFNSSMDEVYVDSVVVNKTYTVTESGGVFSLVFDKSDPGLDTGISYADLEDDIEIILTVYEAPILPKTLHLRQVVLDPAAGLQIPYTGYFNLVNGGLSRGITTESNT
ncbi:MAG: hypothetical protein FWE86_01180, partial [Oscillospiraceae bacterium]|nr:hypothetical protein [Oscillospiraceae bacterium]